MKRIVLLSLLFATSLNFAFGQAKDFTFCFGNIKVTIKDGGEAEMISVDNSGRVIKRIKGEYDLYKGMTPELLKITFANSSTEYSYNLIRDGYGIPTSIFDYTGRRYDLCKVTNSSSWGEDSGDDQAQAEIRKHNAQLQEWAKTYDQRKASRKFASMQSTVGTWVNVAKKVKVIIKYLPLGQPEFGMSSNDLFFKTSDGTRYTLPEDIYEKSLNFKTKDGELVAFDGERRLVEINVTSPEINFKGLVMERETSVPDDPSRPHRYQFVFYNANKDTQFVFTTNSLTNPAKSEINWFTRDPNNWWTPHKLGDESSLSLTKQIIKK